MTKIATWVHVKNRLFLGLQQDSFLHLIGWLKVCFLYPNSYLGFSRSTSLLTGLLQTSLKVYIWDSHFSLFHSRYFWRKELQRFFSPPQELCNSPVRLYIAASGHLINDLELGAMNRRQLDHTAESIIEENGSLTKLCLHGESNAMPQSSSLNYFQRIILKFFRNLEFAGFNPIENVWSLEKNMNVWLLLPVKIKCLA